MQKHITIDGLDLPVMISRRKGTRNLRISLKDDGIIRLSVPYGVPDFAAKAFIRSKIEWVQKNHKPLALLENGMHIGKSHRLVIKHNNASRNSTKITDTEIRVMLPKTTSWSSSQAQTIIKKACEKALLSEAVSLLPQRLNQISRETGIEFNQFYIKKLKSRWGACDNHKNITLNIYLIQLDWKLIDYVIRHELAHTHHPHHQQDFWSYLAQICPDFKQLRSELKKQPTNVYPTNY
jgi:predicted metal-dependent hydrolase